METRNHPHREAWNKGKLVGQKAQLKPKDIWAIRIHLQNAEQQVTGASQTDFGRRPKVGKGRLVACCHWHQAVLRPERSLRACCMNGSCTSQCRRSTKYGEKAFPNETELPLIDRHEPHVVGSGRQAVEHAEFSRVNAVLGNLKTAISGTYHAFKFGKSTIGSTAVSISESCSLVWSGLRRSLRLGPCRGSGWLRNVANHDYFLRFGSLLRRNDRVPAVVLTLGPLSKGAHSCKRKCGSCSSHRPRRTNAARLQLARSQC